MLTFVSLTLYMLLYLFVVFFLRLVFCAVCMPSLSTQSTTCVEDNQRELKYGSLEKSAQNIKTHLCAMASYFFMVS